MKHVLAGMMLPATTTDTALLARYDVLVPNLPTLRWWRDHVASGVFTGKKMVVHAPACYGRPKEYNGDFYDDWYALAEKHDGWLNDDDGVPVKNGNDLLFDMRNIELALAMANALVGHVGSRGVHGYFLDCVWTGITWTSENGYVWKDRAKVNIAWEAGMRAFLARVRTSGKFVCANGWWNGPEVDCLCYEDTPFTSILPPGSRDFWDMLFYANWGIRQHHHLFPSGPWLLPHSESSDKRGPGWGITLDRIAREVAYARTYCQRDTFDVTPPFHSPWSPVVFENTGAVCDVVELT